jgi:DNA-binding GntR family transcriptional regulator
MRMPTLDSPKQNIRGLVYASVREQLQRGEIGYEDRLVDHEIAASMNVSRMPVREALMQLKAEGYLQSTSRGFVLPQFTPTDVANIFEIRLLLEPTAAASACLNSTVEGMGRMKIAATEAERAHKKSDFGLYVEANTAFRTAWVEMVPNPHLAQIISRLRDHAQAVRIATLKEREFRVLSLKHTRSILEAFLMRDAQAARDRVEANLRIASASYYARQEAFFRQEQAGEEDAAAPPEEGAAARKNSPRRRGR